MFFNFYKYLNPVYYFNLKPVDPSPAYVVDYKKIPETDKLQLNNSGDRYSTNNARALDKAYQLFQKGYISNDKAVALNIREENSVVNNYVFIKKYFGGLNVARCFIFRLLLIELSLKDFKGLYRASKQQQLKTKHIPVQTKINEEVISAMGDPLVSVIIPTLNRYKYLKDVLHDLERQHYKNFEVIVIDQSEPYNPDFYKNFKIDIKLIHQKEKALWLARNTAVKSARGEYILLFDDDSRIDPDWISEHLKCIEYFNADISSGVSLSAVGGGIPHHYSFYRWSDQLDTGNALIHKDVFCKTGLFDRQFEKQRMGDGEFGLRSFLAGFKNISNPNAKRLHLKVGSGGLRTWGSWDGFRPKNLFEPRPIPSVIYFFMRYFGKKATIISILNALPRSVIPYQYKKSKGALFIGFIYFLLLSPVILFQVRRSWKLAAIKLKQGPLIEDYKNYK